MRNGYISIIIPFLAFCFLPVILTGQHNENSQGVQILWQEDLEPVPGQALLTFEGAVNADDFGLLPVFQLVLKAGQHINTDQPWSNAVYIPWLPDSRSVYPDIELIGDQPGFSFSTITVKKNNYQVFSLLPLRKSPDGTGYQKLVFFTLNFNGDHTPTEMRSPARETRTYAGHSVLSSGEWHRLRVDDYGIYRLEYADLEAMGIPLASTDPRNIRIFGNGSGMLDELNATPRPDDLIENAIFISGEEDGVFDPADYILFYGEGPTVVRYNPFYLQYEHEINLYTDETHYFLTYGNIPGKRVIQADEIPQEPTHELYTFQDLAWHEKDSINLIKSGKTWFGEVFGTQTDYTFPFTLKNIDPSEPVVMKINMAARSTVSTVFNVYTEGVFFREIDVPSVLIGSQIFARSIITNYDPFYANDEQVDIRIEFEKIANIDIAWLNYIELNYIRRLKLDKGQLMFRDMRHSGADKVVRFHIEAGNQQAIVWDVTDPMTVKKAVTYPETGGIAIKAPADQFREFIAFDGTDFLKPDYLGTVANQDLHGLDPVEYIIVSHPDFLGEAGRLAAYHLQTNGLRSHIVTPAQIYNEFSGGVQDVTAIRDFMKMLYDRSGDGSLPQYLLLFGDASYDYKDILDVNHNLVPAFQSRESLKFSGSFVTDDYFGCLDDDEGSNGSGNMDVGVGRFPVVAIEDARALVDKTISYMEPARKNFGPWRNYISYIGDDKDNNIHLNQAEGLADITDSLGLVYNVNKIYLDAYEQVKTGSGVRYPDVNKAINKDINDGCLIMNYTGHGGEIAWADERVLDIPAIQSFRNSANLPAFVTATCEFSRYDDPGLVSAGELVLLNPDGGGICLFTTTRTSYSQSNYAYNKRFYYEAFRVDSTTGEYPRLGDLIIAAKNPSNTNIKNFVLLGDPAVMLAYPKMRVRTGSIEYESTGEAADTVKALSKITVKGWIEDMAGQPLNQFNGKLETTIYDKPVLYKTRGNEIQSKVKEFYIQNKKIFRGESTIINGEFSFSFIVPVDISYQFGDGKISYYALDTLTMTDAHGFDQILIGGSAEDAIADTEGPEIDLYLNTFSFESGDITTSDPLLIAKLFDESGINTVGNGIGHDIVAVINGDSQEPIVLNDYFTPDADSYQGGTVKFRLDRFENGTHTVTLRAWDVLNNSSEKTITFVVNSDARLALTNLKAQPNPYKESTYFSFQHNKPGSPLEVVIRIYNLSGMFVNSIQTQINTESTDSGLLYWDGKDFSGNELSAGLYVYQVLVTSGDGYEYIISQKLLHYR